MFTWLRSTSARFRSAAAECCLGPSSITLERHRVLATGLLFSELGGLTVYSIRDLAKSDKSAVKPAFSFLAASIFGASFVAMSGRSVCAAKFGTQDEVMAMVA
jgi:hypothetical protein